MKTILLCLLFISIGCKSQKIGLSKRIYEVQKEICGDKEYLKVFEKNRNEVLWIQKIERMYNDTVYLIEEHYYSDEIIPIQHMYHAMFWNKREAKMIYSYHKKDKKIKMSIEKPEENDILYHLVNNWDTIQIKKRAIYENQLGGDVNTIVTRIIVSNKQIESLCFKTLF